MACLVVIYGMLSSAAIPFANVILPSFLLMIGIYMLLNLTIFLKFLMFLWSYSKSSLKK